VSWLVKLLGGGLGFAMGGPLGALAGVALGHGVDRWLSSPSPVQWRRPPGYYGAQTGGAGPGRGDFFYATFAIMGHLAKADGRVSEREIAVAETVMGRWQLPADQRRVAIGFFNRGKAPGFPLDRVLDGLRRDCLGQEVLLAVFLETQFQMAYAEGTVAVGQRALLLHAARRLGVSAAMLRLLGEAARLRWGTDAAEGARARFRPGRGGGQPGSGLGGTRAVDALAAAYSMLGVPSTASDAEVKRAYRRLLSQHHPDKLVSKGLPPHVLKLADEKTYQIRNAYEVVTRERAT
jgi:DnaJ like chaperone protein